MTNPHRLMSQVLGPRSSLIAPEMPTLTFLLQKWSDEHMKMIKSTNMTSTIVV